MEMRYAQILMDSGISANWVMAGLLAILLIIMKRSGDAADRREKKIDEILEKQQVQLNNHELMLARHSERLDGYGDDIAEQNRRLAERAINTIRAATGKRLKDEE